MTAYGASDAEIQSKLQAQNLWSPDGSGGGGANTGQVTGIINQNIGGDGPYPGQVVDQTSFADYQFDKSDYAPGGKLEINPAALGMSFFEQPGSGTQTFAASKGIDMNAFNQGDFNQKKEMVEKAGLDFNMDTLEKLNQPQEKGFIESFMSAAVPNKMTSEFRTPTGIIPKGPQELGFMTKDIFGKPYGSANTLTRDQLREMYDNYSKFWGRGSNYEMAKVPGSAENLFNLIPYVGTAKKGLEAIFGPGGDRSMQSKYTVDNAGWGNTGMKDEFGVNTFSTGDSIFSRKDAPTRDYLDRMQDKMTENIDFFGGTRWGFGGKELDKKGSSVSLTVDGKTMDFKEAWENFDTLDTDDQQALIDKMKTINGFKTKQMLAYKNRIATETLNKDWHQKEAERIKAKELADQQAIQEAATRRTYSLQDLQDSSPNEQGQSYAAARARTASRVGSDGKVKAYGLKDGGLATMFIRRR
jgi:hypothetical protein